MKTLNERSDNTLDELIDNLRRLGIDQIKMIDEALGCIGEFGEVRLVVEKGRLRYLVVQKSVDALKWVPGQLINNGKDGRSPGT